MVMNPSALPLRHGPGPGTSPHQRRVVSLPPLLPQPVVPITGLAPWRAGRTSRGTLSRHPLCCSSQQPEASSAVPQPSTATSPDADDGTAASSSQASASTSSPTGTTPGSPKKHGSFWGWLPPAACLQLFKTTMDLLRSNFWAIILLYMIKDGIAFLLHRASQRLTNLVCDNLLGTSISSTANPWWLYLDSAFLESNPGYQVFIVVFFLLALPLNILVASAAATAAAQLCVPPPEQAAINAAVHVAQLRAERAKAAELGIQASTSIEDVAAPKADSEDLLALAQRKQEEPGSGESPSQGATTAQSSTNGSGAAPGSSGAGAAAGEAGQGSPAGSSGERAKKGLVQQLREALADVRGTLPPVQLALKRVWWVDCLFNMRALPLQALSLLVLPVPWTVPRLLSIQLAVPASILEGRSGRAALQRSAQLMSVSPELKAAYGWPFVALILAVRVLDGLRNVVLTAIPVRWWQDVVEVPLLITAAFAFAKLLVIRLQDLLPLAAYLVAQRREAGEAQDTQGASPITLPAPPPAMPTI